MVDSQRPPSLAMVWLGPLIAAFGLISYFALFSRWPLLRDTAGLNLAIVALGLIVSIFGLARVWHRSTVARIGSILSTGLSLTAASTLVWYVFVHSNRLPDDALALDVGDRIPDLSLPDSEGRAVALGPRADEKVVLVFYRGHW